MKTLYISDLDGTLLNSKKEITQFSADVINLGIEAGKLFTVATARMPYGCDYRLEQIYLSTPAILTNGVFIYDFSTKKYLHVETIDKSVAKAVITAFTEHGKHCFLYLFEKDEISICYGDAKLEAQEQYYSKRALATCKSVHLTDNYEREMECGEVFYVTLTGAKEELKPICESLDKIKKVQYACYLNIYNGLYCLEVFSEKASKKQALMKLKEMVACDELVVFGDNWNDMSMIEIADRSYAPDNALDEVKKEVTEVLASCDDDGVARFLQEEWNIFI